MIDLLMIVVRWLAGFRSGAETTARPKRSLPPVRAVCGLRRGMDCAIDALRDIGWMTVRLDSRSCVRVLSRSSPVWRGSTARFMTLHRGGV